MILRQFKIYFSLFALSFFLFINSAFSKGPFFVLSTDFGDMVFELMPEIAPYHVNAISRLSSAGLFDGISFFKIEPGFLAQVNDVRARASFDFQRMGSLIQKIPAEFSNYPHDFGVLSMAHPADDRNGAESSFFITLGRLAEFDKNYSVFGKIYKGQGVLSAFNKMALSAGELSLRTMVLRRAWIIQTEKALAHENLQTEPNGLRYVNYLTDQQKHDSHTIGWVLFFIYILASASIYLNNRNRIVASNACIFVICLSSICLILKLFYSWGAPVGWVSFLLFILIINTFRLMSRFEARMRNWQKNNG